MNTTLTDDFNSLLSQLLHTGTPFNRSVVKGDRGDIVIWRDQETSSLTVNLASGRFLKERLSPQEAQKLYQLGFRQTTVARPWTCRFDESKTKNLEEISLILTSIFNQIYSPQSSSFSSEIVSTPFPTEENPRLMKAMERLSKERNQSARQKLYWALSKANLLLALNQMPSDPASPSQEDLHANLHTVYFSKSYDSAIVFSDWESVLRYDFRGMHVYPLLGRKIVHLLVQRSIASLLINPRGQTGGELYKNELESIYEVMKDY